MATIYDFVVEDLDGTPVELSTFRGRVLLIVNTASFCAYTPQYADLVTLQGKLRDEGLTVLAFPSNQFGAQEPGDASEIATFCRVAYDVTFPVFAKIDVRGAHAHPLFQWLTEQKRGLFGSRSIKWNFTKFLIDRDGKVRRRFSPRTRPAAIEPHIRLLL